MHHSSKPPSKIAQRNRKQICFLASIGCCFAKHHVNRCPILSFFQFQVNNHTNHSFVASPPVVVFHYQHTLIMNPIHTIKQVRFSETSELIVYRPPNESDLGSHYGWYSDSDLASFKQYTAGSILNMRSSISQKSTDGIDASNFMGIDKFLSTEVARKHQERKRECVAAVLAEQQRQRMIGARSCTMLAMISKMHSLWAREQAHSFAVFYMQRELNPCCGDGSSSSPKCRKRSIASASA